MQQQVRFASLVLFACAEQHLVWLLFDHMQARGEHTRDSVVVCFFLARIVLVLPFLCACAEQRLVLLPALHMRARREHARDPLRFLPLCFLGLRTCAVRSSDVALLVVVVVLGLLQELEPFACAKLLRLVVCVHLYRQSCIPFRKERLSCIPSC